MRRFNSLSTFNMSFVLLAAPESILLYRLVRRNTVFAEFEGLPDPLLYFS